MRSDRYLVASLSAVMAMFLIPSPSASDLLGPTIAVDIQASEVPDISTIDSVYSGDAEFLYAFLVVGDMPGGYISGYDLGFDLTSPDSNVMNLGFSRLPSWLSADPADDGSLENAALPGARTPAAIGYWTLWVGNASDSTSMLRLMPNPLNGASTIRLFDETGGCVVPVGLFHGLIDHGVPTRPDTLPPSDESDSLDAYGRPTGYRRSDSYVPGQVIGRFYPGMIDLPEDSQTGSLASISDPDIKARMESFSASTIERLYRNAVRGVREITTRGGQIVTLESNWDVYIVHFPQDLDAWEVADSLAASPGCVYAHPNGIGTICAEPLDGYWGQQWAMIRVGADLAWDTETGDTEVRIGIVDTGIDYNHGDLGGGIGTGFKVVDGYDFVNLDFDPMDDHYECLGKHSHGTHVAGIAGALTNNDYGVAGLAGGWYPENSGCSLVALKAADHDGYSTVSSVSNAVSSALSIYQVDILNLSLAFDEPYAEIRSVIKNAHKAGVVCVAAKGNDSTDAVRYPADCDDPWIISVGASNNLDPYPGGYEGRVFNAGWFNWTSNYGNDMDLLAPGVNIKSTVRTAFPPPWQSFDGTSMSAPHVTGIAALIRSMEPELGLNLHVEDIEGLICASCTDVRWDAEGGTGEDMRGYDEYSGWGRVNADSAVKFLQWPYVLSHHTSGGGYSVGSTDSQWFLFMTDGDPPYGFCFGKRYEVRCDVTYSQAYGTFPHVWGRGYGASTGWGKAQGIYKIGHCEVVPGSQTWTGCQLRSYVYRITDVFGHDPEWHPCQPNQVVFAHTVLGGMCTASVSGRTGGDSQLAVRHVSPRPNPFEREVSIQLEVKTESSVEVAVYDVQGRRVRLLREGRIDPGKHTVVWDGKNDLGERLSAGVYTVRIRASESDSGCKIVLLE